MNISIIQCSVTQRPILWHVSLVYALHFHCFCALMTEIHCLYETKVRNTPGNASLSLCIHIASPVPCQFCSTLFCCLIPSPVCQQDLCCWPTCCEQLLKSLTLFIVTQIILFCLGFEGQNVALTGLSLVLFIYWTVKYFFHMSIVLLHWCTQLLPFCKGRWMKL